MQHLYCDTNPSRTGEYCSSKYDLYCAMHWSTACLLGLPLRLWECAECNAKPNRYVLAEAHQKKFCSPDEKWEMHSNNCTVCCNKAGNTRYIPMPDGAACALSEADTAKGVLAYCFRGACFAVNPANRSGAWNVKSKKECELEKNERKRYWDKYTP